MSTSNTLSTSHSTTTTTTSRSSASTPTPSKPTPQELPLLISPLVPDSLVHNTRTLSTLRSPTSFLLGLSAGILSLHSLYGFLFYLLGTLAVSALIHTFLIKSAAPTDAGARVGGVGVGVGGGVGRFFPGSGVRDGKRDGAWRDVWVSGVGEGVSGFVLGWAGVGGVLR